MGVRGIEFKSIAVCHDRVKSAEHGFNTIFVLQLDGIRLAHLGDPGHSLSSRQRGEPASSEIRFAPTGRPTVTPKLQEVINLWESLKPRAVILMHFERAKCTIPKYGAGNLVRVILDARRTGASEFSVTKEGLPHSGEILAMGPLR